MALFVEPSLEQKISESNVFQKNICNAEDRYIFDEENNIYLAKVLKFQNVSKTDEKLKEYKNKQNSNLKNTMLKSYDIFLNDKYNVVLNQKTIERVKNFFK